MATLPPALTVRQAHGMCETMRTLEDAHFTLAPWVLVDGGFVFQPDDLLLGSAHAAQVPPGDGFGVLGVVEFVSKAAAAKQVRAYYVHLRPVRGRALFTVGVTYYGPEGTEPVLTRHEVEVAPRFGAEFPPTVGRNTAKVVLGAVRAHAARLADTAPEPGTPLPVGTPVWHTGQQWARSLPGGTAVITKVDGPYGQGNYEYTVRGCRDFSRRPGPDNPMDTPRHWPGWTVVRAMPPGEGEGP